MFIVKSGKIQVIGGPSGTQVLASLGEGSVFGEIALLGIGGMNKRTADVRAAGFVNLFVLNKSDLNDVIRDYPEAQDIMQRKAKKLMRENIKKARASPSPAAVDTPEDSLVEESVVIIKNKEEPPQLIHAMLKLFPQTTKIGRYLRKGSKQSPFIDEIIEEDRILSKPEEDYTSFTSYPPSPFIPISPVNISQELDISIMTGDSSERLLSPPDGPHKSSELFKLSQEQGPDPAGEDNCQERPQSTVPPFLRPPTDENLLLKSTSDPTTVETLVVEEEEFGNFVSKEPRKSCPHFESFMGTNREEIPIALRPPLYIIESRNIDGGNGQSGTSKSRILRRIVLQQDSSASMESVVESAMDDDNDDAGGIDSIGGRRSPPSTTTSTTAMMIASRFLSKIRGPLERQSEVDIDLPTGTFHKKVPHRETPQLSIAGDVEASYSLDIDSD